MHVHCYSFDSSTDPEEYLKSISNNKNTHPIDGILITEHDKMNRKETGHLESKYGIKVLKAIEFGLFFGEREGHFNIIGMDEDFLKSIRHLGPKKVIKSVNQNGGIVIANHPFSGQYYIANELKNLDIDILEVISGRGHFYQNRAAIKMAKRFGYKGIGGSDAHNIIADFGNCATYFKNNIRTVNELIEELNNDEYHPVYSFSKYDLNIPDSVRLENTHWMEVKIL